MNDMDCLSTLLLIVYTNIFGYFWTSRAPKHLFRLLCHSDLIFAIYIYYNANIYNIY